MNNNTSISNSINGVWEDNTEKMSIALVAHDAKKPDLLNWAEFNRQTLAHHNLIGTGTTGKLISENLQLDIHCLLSGPLGGDQQLGALIAEQKLDLLVFFADPLAAAPHEPDVRALLRLATVWNVPIALNRSTADMAISSPLFHDWEYTPEIPDYQHHNNRTVALAN